MSMMTEYDVRYYDKRHIQYVYKLLANDVRHAIEQFQELMPGRYMTSVLPADQWSDK